MPVDKSVGMLRRPEHPQQATFLELFFDLVFIFTLNTVVTLLVQDLHRPEIADRRVVLNNIGETLLSFLPLVWIWVMTAWTTSRFNPLCPPVQAVVVFTMVGALIMSATMPSAFGQDSLIFASVYVLIQWGRSAFFTVVMRGHVLGQVHLRELIWFSVSAVPWIAGGLINGPPRDMLWLSAIAIDYAVSLLGWPVPGVGRSRTTAWATATEHLAERYRQFLIITLGESILVIGRAYARPALFNPSRTAAVGISFAITVLLWRIYFYRAGQILAQAITWSADRVRLGRVAGWANLAMVFGVLLTSTGYELVIKDPLGEVRPGWLLVVFGGPALYLAGRAAFEHIVFGRISPPRLIGIAVLGVVGAFMIGLPPVVVLLASALVLCGIAVADAVRAHGKPLEEPSPPH
ncbi:low temperature requirement protein A [Micromonospora zhanjiangensis]|uniref:Low temperature requirement protein A n=1 Tax=Micromonospora zhanjiangensis TaxID=1522057 RepID=A0ABV8KQ93_9ACTN